MSIKARFELREKLGEGATSEVYDAYDKSLRRHVAIKLFKTLKRGGVYAELKERFLVDARAAARERESLARPMRVYKRVGGHIRYVYVRKC